jgi:hypothetical protein
MESPGSSPPSNTRRLHRLDSLLLTSNGNHIRQVAPNIALFRATEIGRPCGDLGALQPPFLTRGQQTHHHTSLVPLPRHPRLRIARRRVAFHFAITLPHPPSHTRPRPVFGLSDQPSFDWVSVSIPHLAAELLPISHVPIKPATLLPEPRITTSREYLCNAPIILLTPLIHNPFRHCGLERAQRRTEGRPIRRAKKKMHMLGHDNPCEELKAVAEPRGGEFSREHVACSRVSKQG